jgi:mannose-6-phosphate isomerase-like protein (cupin superfamily)
MNPADSNPTQGTASKRQIVIFRESKATTMQEATVMENHNSPAANAGIAKMMEAGLQNGYELKCLFKSRDPNGFSLTYAWFKGNYPLPRHTHNTDCLYYVISGEIHMGSEILRAGDGFFLPADAVYAYRAGPDGVEVLEFRDSCAFDIAIKDGSAQAWDRLASVCAANQELWMHQRPPTRHSFIERSALPT